MRYHAKVIAFWPNPDSTGCASACNSAAGNNNICVVCGDDEDGFGFMSGAGWVDPGSSEPQESMAFSKTFSPNAVGIWDKSLNAHREYRIGKDVPQHVVAELKAAARKKSSTVEISPEARSYETEESMASARLPRT